MRYKYLIILSIVAFAAVLCSPTPGFATILLDSAQSFAVLGYAGVTNAHSDPNPQTTIWGNVGVYPGPLTAITGFPPGIVTGGTIHGPDGVSQQALADVNTAYTTLAGSLPVTSNLSGQDLGYMVLTPGVYKFNSSAQLTGPLTLNFQGNPNADFIFQIGSTLTTESGSSVNVINGNSTSGVYWQVGSSAALGDDTVFAGNILAYASVALNPRAEILCGRAFSLTESVTLIDNVISNDNTAQDFGSGRPDFGSYGFSGSATPIPEPSTMLLLGLGSAVTAFIRKRRKA